jgi:hypothetical protein
LSQPKQAGAALAFASGQAIERMMVYLAVKAEAR